MLKMNTSQVIYYLSRTNKPQNLLKYGMYEKHMKKVVYVLTYKKHQQRSFSFVYTVVGRTMQKITRGFLFSLQRNQNRNNSKNHFNENEDVLKKAHKTQMASCLDSVTIIFFFTSAPHLITNLITKTVGMQICFVIFYLLQRHVLISRTKTFVTITFFLYIYVT